MLAFKMQARGYLHSEGIELQANLSFLVRLQGSISC